MLELAIVNIGAMFLLIYNLNYVYWIRYTMVRPFKFWRVWRLKPGSIKEAAIKEARTWWAGYSMSSFKPFTCLSCSVLWLSIIESLFYTESLYNADSLYGSMLHTDPLASWAFILGSFTISAIIQKLYEK